MHFGIECVLPPCNTQKLYNLNFFTTTTAMIFEFEFYVEVDGNGWHQ